MNMRDKTNIVIGFIVVLIVAFVGGLGSFLYTNYSDVNNITTFLQAVTSYVDYITYDNEFATGAILTGLMGGLTFISRDIPSMLYYQFVKHTTTTIATDSTQEAYHSLMRFFLNEGMSDLSRYIKLGSGHYGDDETTTKEIGYGKQLFVYRNNLIFVNHYKEENGSASSVVKNYIVITKIGRSHKLFDDLVHDMKSQRDINKTSYYTYNYDKEFITSQPKQMIADVIMSDRNRNELTNTLDNFVSSEEWYLKHIIPYQLGILLYGPPGTGKTTLIRAIAAYLNKDILFVSEMKNLIAAAQQINDSIIVVEEIDTFGIGQRKTEEENGKKDGVQELIGEVKTENLGNVLTALDGIITNHGRIIIMTTNHKETLDDALLRPGRIDLKMEIGYLDTQMTRDMLGKFFEDNTIPDNRVANEHITPVMIQNDVINGVSFDEIVNRYTHEVIRG